jgi:hypothetical protein
LLFDVPARCNLDRHRRHRLRRHRAGRVFVSQLRGQPIPSQPSSGIERATFHQRLPQRVTLFLHVGQNGSADPGDRIRVIRAPLIANPGLGRLSQRPRPPPRPTAPARGRKRHDEKD